MRHHSNHECLIHLLIKYSQVTKLNYFGLIIEFHLTYFRCHSVMFARRERKLNQRGPSGETAIFKAPLSKQLRHDEGNFLLKGLCYSSPDMATYPYELSLGWKSNNML